MESGRRGGLRASAAAGLLLLLAVTGCGAAGNGTDDAGTPPAASVSPGGTPPRAAGTQAATAPAVPTTQGVPQTQAPAATKAPAGVARPVLPRSEPLALDIPAVGLRTELIRLGLRRNGSLEVPEDTGNGAPAGWYNGSPTPGERGPSVILGHVNALGGNKGVFADLRRLKRGDTLRVARADGSTAVFIVERGAVYGKDSFPTLEVYGNTAGAELRLITCDGYDPATGLFDDNYVIYAKLKA